MKYYIVLLALLLTACGSKAGIVAQMPPMPQEPEIVYIVVTATPAPTAMPTKKPFRHVAHYVDFPDSPVLASVEDGAIMGFSLPDWMEVCQDAGVYSNPYGLNEPFYTVKAGETVRIHDISHDNTWVMVASARWIPINALCWNK